MNIAHELNLFKPQIVKPENSGHKALELVYNAISNGFNMTHNDVSRVTGYSVAHIINKARELYNLGYLSKIIIKNNMNVDQFAYTAIKPFKGE